MKQKLLKIMRGQDGFVSGQEICEGLGVSRTAIWKVINQLKEEGYEIEAQPRKGYRLVSSPDLITVSEVGSWMHTDWIGNEMISIPVIDSTNTRAKQLAEDGAKEGLLVLADRQDAGKGRRGRIWQTPEKTAIAMSVLLCPQIALEKVSAVTLVMGLAVTQAIRQLYGLDARIKWPNDVVIKGKKVCGILTEMSAQMDMINYLVIGTGINVNVTAFPEEIEKTATSLYLETGKRQSRAQLISKCMEVFEEYYKAFLQTQDMSLLKEAYGRVLVNAGKQVVIQDVAGEYGGIAEGINEKGELLVRKADGTLAHVYAGEVSVRGVYGYV